mgnify:CR=1 FL=1
MPARGKLPLLQGCAVWSTCAACRLGPGILRTEGMRTEALARRPASPRTNVLQIAPYATTVMVRKLDVVVMAGVAGFAGVGFWGFRSFQAGLYFVLVLWLHGHCAGSAALPSVLASWNTASINAAVTDSGAFVAPCTG